MSSPRIYRQVRLGDSSGQFTLRLLTLVKGEYDQPLVARLRTCKVSKKRPWHFEALSYVWGPSTSPSKIKLLPGKRAANGRFFSRRSSYINITANLACALKHLRYADRDRVLWVDAVCIDQSSLEERSAQVQKMSEIYSMASRVLIWLGPEDDDGKLAIDAITNFSTKVAVDWTSNTIAPAKGVEEEDRQLGDPGIIMPFSDEEALAVEKLVQRPWFERLWVVQEARLGGDKALVVCGQHTLAWGALLATLVCSSIKKTALLLKRRTPYKNALIESLLDIHNPLVSPTTQHLFHKACLLKCTDERDRMYSLAPLAGTSLEDLDIKPDYSLPVAEVYKDFVLKLISVYGNINIIQGFKISESGPSWVPAFDLLPDTDFALPGSASAKIGPDVEYLGSNRLRVAGVQCATVNAVTPMKNAGLTYNSVATFIQDIVPDDIHERAYVTGCSGLQAMAATLTCALNEESVPPPEVMMRPSDAEALFSKIINHEGDFTDIFTRQEHVLIGALHRDGRGRCFATTNEGYYALAPGEAQPGDVICTILGLMNQMLLRPSKDGEYRVVGPCFVHGLNSGEPLLGEMPSHWSELSVYNEQFKSFGSLFRNKITGETQIEDPRQEVISQELHRAGIGRAIEKNSKILRVELVKRGVQIRDFILV